MMQNEIIIDNFKKLYNTLDRDTLNFQLLNDVYDDNIEFKDCFHNINGINSLFNYFDGLYENVSFIRFDFSDHWLSEDSGVLTWVMSYQHPKLNGGALIQVEGISQLNFKDGKIVRHRDYFDGGALLYEHIPILKRIIIFLKNRMS